MLPSRRLERTRRRPREGPALGRIFGARIISPRSCATPRASALAPRTAPGIRRFWPARINLPRFQRTCCTRAYGRARWMTGLQRIALSAGVSHGHMRLLGRVAQPLPRDERTLMSISINPLGATSGIGTDPLNSNTISDLFGAIDQARRQTSPPPRRTARSPLGIPPKALFTARPKGSPTQMPRSRKQRARSSRRSRDCKFARR